MTIHFTNDPTYNVSEINENNEIILIFIKFPWKNILNEIDAFADRCAPCRLEVRQLTYRKQEQHTAILRAKCWANNVCEAGK